MVNMRKVCYIMRGIPGSGKSWFANKILEDANKYGVDVVIHSADDYRYFDGVYVFNIYTSMYGHATCQQAATISMREGVPIVIIDNTNLYISSIRPYYEAAIANGYKVIVLNVVPPTPEVATQRNIHSVPADTIANMYAQWHQAVDWDSLGSGIDVVNIGQ